MLIHFRNLLFLHKSINNYNKTSNSNSRWKINFTHNKWISREIKTTRLILHCRFNHNFNSNNNSNKILLAISNLHQILLLSHSKVIPSLNKIFQIKVFKAFSYLQAISSSTKCKTMIRCHKMLWLIIIHHFIAEQFLSITQHTEDKGESKVQLPKVLLKIILQCNLLTSLIQWAWNTWICLILVKAIVDLQHHKHKLNWISWIS